MFLHLSICPRGGGVCLNACWDTTPREQAPHQSRYPPRAGTPGQTATVADGTHPTGIHSYFLIVVDGDDCADSPCQNNASCIDLVGNYDCLCPQEFIGRNCSSKGPLTSGESNIVSRSNHGEFNLMFTLRSKKKLAFAFA